jgi:hypothetical protein
MTPAAAGAAARIVLLVLFALALILDRRRPARRAGERAGGSGGSAGGALSPALLWTLAALALLAHLDFMPWRNLHTHEFFHYYVGTKYFPELGYTRLYDATVIADSEDAPATFDPDSPMRSLWTYEVGPRRMPLLRLQATKGRFTPERWAAFKRDVAFFRARDGVLWTMGDSVRDFGYNGSPLVTAILGGIARLVPLPAAGFIPIAAWFDIALVVLVSVVAALKVDARAGPLFLFLWAVNPLNDHAYIGGAYLRTLHILALFAALLAFARRRFVLSGALAAVAALLRVFPILFLAGLFAQNLLHRDRRALLRRHAPLYASAAMTAAVLVAMTSFVSSSGDPWAWTEFASKMRLHSQRLSPNVLGLAYPFFYSETHDVEHVVAARATGQNVNWVEEAHRTLAVRRPLYVAALLLLFAALVVLLRRGVPEDGWLAGLLAVFALLHLAHYDYSVLALVPFIFPGRRDVLAALTLYLVAAGLLLAPGLVAGLDRRFLLASVATALFLATLVGLRVHDALATAQGDRAARRRVSP